jgi:hypothetical protein
MDSATPGTALWSPAGLPPEDLTRLVDQMMADAAADSVLRSGPVPAVLDTDCVRTGLHYQLANGGPPASVTIARDGMIRLFMEYDTLTEAIARLPRFSRQLGVPVAELRRILDEDWLPHVQVVTVPDRLRHLDPRAAAVRDADPNDYAAASLAALLSPCILLTRDRHHFAALGVRTAGQGVDAVMALIDVNIGEVRVQMAVALPAAPVRLAVAGSKWACDRIGPVAFGAILIAAAAGGIWWYTRQPEERREQIKDAVSTVGKFYTANYVVAAQAVSEARASLRGSLVPRPAQRSVTSAILRELAISPGSLSAQQLAGQLAPSLRPSVTDLRAFLRANDAMFDQVRRGGYELGLHYQL